jgi:hypothetical protein
MLTDDLYSTVSSMLQLTVSLAASREAQYEGDTAGFTVK